MNKGQRRVIQWDAKTNGTVLGQPYTHGQTYKEWVKSTGSDKPDEWKQPKS